MMNSTLASAPSIIDVPASPLGSKVTLKRKFAGSPWPIASAWPKRRCIGRHGSPGARSLPGYGTSLIYKYYHITLPIYLGFFAGKRFVPIVTAFAAILLGVVLSFVWAPVGEGISAFSDWASTGSPQLAFTVYGFIERLLIPFGLHHIWNVPFFFKVGQYRVPGTGVGAVVLHGVSSCHP